MLNNKFDSHLRHIFKNFVSVLPYEIVRIGFKDKSVNGLRELIAFRSHYHSKCKIRCVKETSVF